MVIRVRTRARAQLMSLLARLDVLFPSNLEVRLRGAIPMFHRLVQELSAYLARRLRLRHSRSLTKRIVKCL